MPSQFFGLTVAFSGVNSYQASLNTTANNISNVKTEGYSKQVANLSASQALRFHTKYGTVGTGVEVTSVTQIRNLYYDQKYWLNQSSLGLFEAKLNYLRQIEDLYIDDDAEKGFTTIFNEMFGALDTLKNTAEDVSVRQQFVSKAQNFAAYFNSVATGLQEIQESINTEIKYTVANINMIGQKIALLNKQINVIELEGGYANELRDQRALLIDELSSIVPVEVSEVPVTNSKFPDMYTGANYYSVKINGQTLVDTYDYYTLSCVAREQKVNQSDIDGLYDIYWDATGNKFQGGAYYSSGSLKGLFDVRDGNNEENFKGTVNSIEKDGQILNITNPSIKTVNALSMPVEGILTIDGRNYSYTDFTFETDENGNITKYTFKLKEPLTMDQRANIEGRKMSVGESIDAKGVPYYMAQMNEFLRSFASAFNEIMEEGKDLNGNEIDFSFFKAINPIDGEEINFINLKTDQEEGTDTKVYSARDNTYYWLTSKTFSVDKACTKDATKIATTAAVTNGDNTVEDGVAAYDLVERMLLLKSDVVIFRGAGSDDFLECIYSDITVDTQEADIFYQNYYNISNTIYNQRTSISGVDEDEEALDLMKFQNAYNLSSKMVSVFAEIYDRLILETGV